MTGAHIQLKGSQASYARHRACSRAAVSKAVRNGWISAAIGAAGLIDFEYADILWARNARSRIDSGKTSEPQSTPPGRAAGTETEQGAASAPGASDGNYNDLRIRRERASVEREERENAKEAGKLIDRESTERAIFDAFRQLRDAIISAAPRAAPKVIGLSDTRDIESTIIRELRQAFEGWEVRMLDRLPAKEQS